MRARIEPGGAAAEEFDFERSPAEIGHIELGDFEFAAGGWFEVFGDLADVGIVEIERVWNAFHILPTRQGQERFDYHERRWYLRHQWGRTPSTPCL